VLVVNEGAIWAALLHQADSGSLLLEFGVAE